MKKKQGFRALHVRTKPKPGRGDYDSTAVVDALTDSWGDLQEALDKLPDDEVEALKAHFNSCIEDEDDLGDHLFGESDAFDARFGMLGDDQKEEFVKHILDAGLLDKSSFTT